MIKNIKIKISSFILEVLGLITIITSVLVITADNPVVSVIYLIGVFIITACYLVCLGITFVGLTYLVVYVGAVAVLFLFVVIILNVRLSEVVAAGREYTKGIPLAIVVGIVFIYEIGSIINQEITQHNSGIRAGELTFNILNIINNNILNMTNITNDVYIFFTIPIADTSFIVGGVSQVQILGLNLYTYGSLWLLIVSIVLLLAIIGPIALCIHNARNNLILI